MNSGAYRIGVTGHRWFDDVDDVTIRVDDTLRAICGTQHGATIEIWSSLAEGADRLVVERALSLPGTTLAVVLQLEADDYEADFDSASSRIEFRRLLDESASISVTGADEPGDRTSAYRRAGIAVVEAVQTLIAVWDGEPAQGIGGTGEIVELARHSVDTIVVPVTRTTVAP